MDPLIDGYRRFRANVWPGERARYEALAHWGQSPETMVIACSTRASIRRPCSAPSLANCSWCAMSPRSCPPTVPTPAITARARR